MIQDRNLNKTILSVVFLLLFLLFVVVVAVKEVSAALRGCSYVRVCSGQWFAVSSSTVDSTAFGGDNNRQASTPGTGALVCTWPICSFVHGGSGGAVQLHNAFQQVTTTIQNRLLGHPAQHHAAWLALAWMPEDKPPPGHHPVAHCGVNSQKLDQLVILNFPFYELKCQSSNPSLPGFPF